jgi:hypothetical protein
MTAKTRNLTVDRTVRRRAEAAGSRPVIVRGAVAHVIEGVATERRVVIVEFP